jgi:uncharacterized membrane protein
VNGDHHWVAARRVIAGAVVGLVTLVVVIAAGGSWTGATTGAWAAAASVVVVWVWARILHKDAAATKANARKEDFTRPVADLMLLAASVASLVAVAFTLVDAGNDRHNTGKAMLILLAIASVGLAWLSVHTVYVLRYASVYYGDPIGGIHFEGGDPDYRDFAYLGLTIGMTFQVSDTDLQTKSLRRIAIRHALLSWVFGTVIVAVTINIVASLLK